MVRETIWILKSPEGGATIYRRQPPSNFDESVDVKGPYSVFDEEPPASSLERISMVVADYSAWQVRYQYNPEFQLVPRGV